MATDVIPAGIEQLFELIHLGRTGHLERWILVCHYGDGSSVRQKFERPYAISDTELRFNPDSEIERETLEREAFARTLRRTLIREHRRLILDGDGLHLMTMEKLPALSDR